MFRITIACMVMSQVALAEPAQKVTATQRPSASIPLYFDHMGSYGFSSERRVGEMRFGAGYFRRMDAVDLRVGAAMSVASLGISGGDAVDEAFMYGAETEVNVKATHLLRTGLHASVLKGGDATAAFGGLRLRADYLVAGVDVFDARRDSRGTNRGVVMSAGFSGKAGAATTLLSAVVGVVASSLFSPL